MGKRVKTDVDNYLRMAIGVKRLDCSRGVDQHCESKERYKRKRDVTFVVYFV